MTPERAAEIIEKAKARAKHGPWSDQINNVMTSDERRDLLLKWKTMPGTTCFVDVLLSVANSTDK